MGVKVNFNRSELSAALERAKGTVMRNVVNGLQITGETIAETASAMAPRDTGALERSFRVSKAEQARDASGRFGKAGAIVYIDPLAENPDTGEAVTEYAGLMHENLTPYGELQLGEGSREKGGDVGGGFLERALNEHVDEIERVTAKQVEKALR